MAVLADDDRLRISSQFQLNRGLGILLKADINATVVALDNFLDSAAFLTAVNNQIPEPAKSNMTGQNKQILFGLILRKRLGF